MSTSKNLNERAFPMVEKYIGAGDVAEIHRGVTKREYFAGLAMQGLCADYGRVTCAESGIHQNIAFVSVRIADALLAELEEAE